MWLDEVRRIDREGPGVDVRAARLRSMLNPGVGRRLESFQASLAALRATPATPRTVAVVGLVPGAGRSTVTAVMALAAAAYSDRRVLVIDTVTAATGPRDRPGLPPSHDDVAARSVTALLGGDVLQGRLALLLEGEPAAGVPRRRVASALTPDAAVPVLSLPPGPGGFAPQMLERALDRLSHRADLILIDTPPGPRAPVLHAVLDRADRFVLVGRADRAVGRQGRAGRVWLDSAPGRRRERPAALVAVSRGLRAPRPGAGPAVTVLARDEALRRRRPDQMSRTSMITGLELAAAVLAGSGPVAFAAAPDGSSRPLR